ncbi:MAG: hypothetical protein ACTILN_06430 [Marinobacter sp.]
MSAVIEPLLSHGLNVSLEGDRIRLQPKALIDDQVRAYMQAHRQQIIEALTAPLIPDDPLEGLVLLKGDRDFIESMLARYRNRNRHTILMGYREHWLAAASSPELLEHQRDNKGRFAANTWLRTQLN